MRIFEDIEYGLHSENMESIRLILSQRVSMVWAAWGNAILSHKHLLCCLDDIEDVLNEVSCWWVALGATPKKNPYHPLYRGKGFKLYSTPLTPYSRK
jgi:hypothetical protein